MREFVGESDGGAADKEIEDPNHAKGLHSPKRLDPMAIGRNGDDEDPCEHRASPVSSGTAEEVES